MKSPTVVDVARQAGLSVTTVSRVLNNSGYFSRSTLQKVEEAVKNLNYHPNWNARLLKGMPSNLIGLIIPDLSNVFYTALANALLSSLRIQGYDMMLFVNDEDPQKDLSYLQILRQKSVDGIIYTHPTEGNNSAIIQEITSSGIPVVEVNRQSEKDHLDAVLADNLRGAKQVIEYLINLGHQRIGIICGSPKSITGADRVRGYRAALEESGISLDADLLKVGSFTRDYGERAAKQLLDLEKPPSAIFAASNRIILGVLHVFDQNDICVPDDISLVCFDDTEWLDVWNPPITVVDVAIQEMAQLTIDLLIRRINSKEKDIKPMTYYLSTKLIHRASCKKVEVCYN